MKLGTTKTFLMSTIDICMEKLKECQGDQKFVTFTANVDGAQVYKSINGSLAYTFPLERNEASSQI